MPVGVIKEWRCALHGPFEASHRICPAYGCLSESVEREFRTAPKIGDRVQVQLDPARLHRFGISGDRL